MVGVGWLLVMPIRTPVKVTGCQHSCCTVVTGWCVFTQQAAMQTVGSFLQSALYRSQAYTQVCCYPMSDL